MEGRKKRRKKNNNHNIITIFLSLFANGFGILWVFDLSLPRCDKFGNRGKLSPAVFLFTEEISLNSCYEF